MASSEASTPSSKSWLSTKTIETKASSLATSFLSIPLFPSISVATSDSIIALFAGRDAKLRLERKRMLAYFRSLPDPTKAKGRGYQNDHAWANAVGGSGIGQKVVDGVIYRYRISPELSQGESRRSTSQYDACGFTRSHTCPEFERLETWNAERRLSPYDPYPRPRTPEPLEQQPYTKSPKFEFTTWKPFLNGWSYVPSPPIPAARDISTLDWKLPGKKTPGSPTDVANPEQQDSGDLKESDKTRPSTEAAASKSLTPPAPKLGHTIPHSYEWTVHASCFPPEALCRPRAILGCAQGNRPAAKELTAQKAPRPNTAFPVNESSLVTRQITAQKALLLKMTFPVDESRPVAKDLTSQKSPMLKTITEYGAILDAKDLASQKIILRHKVPETESRLVAKAPQPKTAFGYESRQGAKDPAAQKALHSQTTSEWTAHTSCYPTASKPIPIRISAHQNQQLARELTRRRELNARRFGATRAKKDITNNTARLLHNAAQDHTIPCPPMDTSRSDVYNIVCPPMYLAIAEGYKMVQSYYSVEKIKCPLGKFNAPYFSRRKTAEDWKAIQDFPIWMQQAEHDRAKKTELHIEYQLAADYLHRVEDDRETDHTALLKRIHDTKRFGRRTAYAALECAHRGQHWAALAGRGVYMEGIVWPKATTMDRLLPYREGHDKPQDEGKSAMTHTTYPKPTNFEDVMIEGTRKTEGALKTNGSNSKVQEKPKSCISRKLTACYEGKKIEAEDMAFVKRSVHFDNPKDVQLAKNRGRPVSNSKSKTTCRQPDGKPKLKATIKSAAVVGGYSMVREKKRHPVNGKGVRVVVAPIEAKTTRLVAVSEPLPEISECAIGDTDSEDDWDPTCYIEPVRKIYRRG